MWFRKSIRLKVWPEMAKMAASVQCQTKKGGSRANLLPARGELTTLVWGEARLDLSHEEVADSLLKIK